MSEQVEENISKQRVKIAVFDYDGTIINGQSGTLFSRWLYCRKLISFAQASKLFWWGARYKLHLPHRQESVREYIFESLKAFSPDEVHDIMRDFHDEVLIKKIRQDALKEIERRRSQGCAILCVSATFLGILNRAQDFIHADGIIATRMQIDEYNRFTGLVDGPVTEGAYKPVCVQKWADERFGIGNWYISHAYADHYSDQALLEMANHPVAVCPTTTLRRYAKENAWKIAKWR